MAFVNGHTGDITIGGTVCRVKSWTAKLAQKEIETTRKGDQGWQNFTGGIKGIEGSFELDFDKAIHGTGTFPFPLTFAEAAMLLGMSDGTTDAGQFSFNGRVFDLEFTSPVDGIINVKGNFKSCGVVTYATTTPA